MTITSKGFRWSDLWSLKIRSLKLQPPAFQNMKVFGHKDFAEVIKFI